MPIGWIFRWRLCAYSRRVLLLPHISIFVCRQRRFCVVYRFNGCELAPLLMIMWPASSNCKADKDDTPCVCAPKAWTRVWRPQSASEDSLKSDDEPRHPPTMAQFSPPSPPPQCGSVLCFRHPAVRCHLSKWCSVGRVCHVPLRAGKPSRCLQVPDVDSLKVADT